ncbi:MAG: DUF2254 domain-containing protein [Lysobacterales bacterium]
MNAVISLDRLRFLFNRLRERLWVRPLLICVLSIGAAFGAKLADGLGLSDLFPEVSVESVQSLLSIMASSMLVIATFALSSMVSAYASAAATATPRSFPLVLADDGSKNALSTFIGAFIFSIVALVATKNHYFGSAGVFVLFLITALVFAAVVVTFVRWSDGIARLGRLGSTIDKVEAACAAALRRRRRAPTLCARRRAGEVEGHAVHTRSVGYVQHVDVSALQAWAEQHQAWVVVEAQPGTFVTPDRPLVLINTEQGEAPQGSTDAIVEAFAIDGDRVFEDDPRFGLVVLSEIAGRALSPAVNDPGTAIDTIGTLVRLFSIWIGPDPDSAPAEPEFDRVYIAELAAGDLFDDAFGAIARDGAGSVEVGVRLQKALLALARMGDDEVRKAARSHSLLAMKRAERALQLDEDRERVRAAAAESEWFSAPAG